MSAANEYTVPAPTVQRTGRGGKATGWLLGAAAIVALAAMPFVGNAYLTTFVFTMLIAYILAQSWDWVAGEMGYVNLGHYCFYGIGAYGFAIALTGQWPFAVALVFAGFEKIDAYARTGKIR